jgi:hypothetical protein
MHTNQFAEHFNICEAFLPVNVATAPTTATGSR